MLISLGTADYSPFKPVILDVLPGSKLSDIAPRISRTATLDGGCWIEDMGETYADRTLIIKTRVTKAVHDRIEAIIRYNNNWIISYADGLFLGAVETVTGSGGNISVKIMISEKIEWFPPPAVPGIPTFRPAASADDGWTSSGVANDPTFSNSGDYGRIGLSTALNSASDSHIFIRFPNVDIPQNAVITTAYIEFEGYGAYPASNPPQMRALVGFLELGDAPQLANFAEVEAAVDDHLYEEAVWYINDVNAGMPYVTPDLAYQLQWVIKRGDWVAGNAICAIMSLIFNQSDITYRDFKLFDSGKAPKLIVTWTY